MKRNKDTYPKVVQYRTLIFWEECRFCHKEFRREQGFKIIDYKACRYGGESPFFTSYSCNDCANGIDEVKNMIHKEKEEFLKNKPEAPPIKVVKGL